MAKNALYQKALAIAKQVIAQAEDWTVAHNALYGPRGKISKLFSVGAEREAFSASPEKKEITALLAALEEKKGTPAASASHSGRFVVRITPSLHAALTDEAETEGVSLNHLVVTKLASRLRQAI